MRRELIIAAAVLVPFAVLVAVGFYYSPADPPRVLTEQPVVQKSPLPRGGEGQGEGRTTVDASIPAPPPFPPELEAPLTAVLPEVQRCFADQHLQRPREVKVHFTPTPEGGFTQVTVDDQQDPYLAACLEDVFAEVRFRPDGRQTWAPATHTFSFGPSPD